MTKSAKIYITVFSLLFGAYTYAQDKTNFVNIESILKRITPNDKTDFWILVNNEYGKNNEVKVSGTKKEYTVQTAGFNISPREDSFYYIVYSKGGNLNYITQLDQLKNFIGKIDNVEEAAISATLEGYVVDEEFAHVAANYYQDANNYYLDLGKLTSKECPYQKKHYTLTVSKVTGAISNVQDNGSYIEVYTKKCTNNPRLLKLEKKEEPKDDVKKKSTNRR